MTKTNIRTFCIFQHPDHHHREFIYSKIGIMNLFEIIKMMVTVYISGFVVYMYEQCVCPDVVVRTVLYGTDVDINDISPSSMRNNKNSTAIYLGQIPGNFSFQPKLTFLRENRKNDNQGHFLRIHSIYDFFVQGEKSGNSPLLSFWGFSLKNENSG